MRERSFAFGPSGTLVGTLCLPDAGLPCPAPMGVILFNAGVIHRVGPHRFNVRLARRLAALGIASLRFDLSGQGDSPRARVALDYEEQGVRDVRDAIDALSRETGIRYVTLYGTCSSGCYSYATAQQDARVAGLLLHDTYIFHTAWSRVHRILLKLRHRGAAAIVSSLWRWLTSTAKYTSPLGNPGIPRAAAGAFVTPDPALFARVVRSLEERGTRVGMLYSGAFEEYNYANQFRDRFRPLGLGDSVTCDYFPELGHTSMDLAGQARLLDRVASWCAERNRGLKAAATA